MQQGRQGRRTRLSITRSAASIECADRTLLARLARELNEAARQAGEQLRCAPGCDECCHGPFPITRLDVRRLRGGLAQLQSSDAARALRVRRRAEQAVSRLTLDFPGQAATGRLAEAESEVEPFFERHAAMPCPALDPQTRTCDLYDWRPVTCRTYGPPARFGDQTTPPCRLCFVGADSEQIERCRIEPDREGLEQMILEALSADADGGDWETLVAFALGTTA
jgi:Fe-S-cluster containining protein